MKKTEWWIARNKCPDGYAIVMTKSNLRKVEWSSNSFEWTCRGDIGASDLCPRAVHRMLGVKLKPGEVKRIEVTVKEL